MKTTITASWYGEKFHGKTMADGNTFNMYDPTIVAHRFLPLGTVLKVQNLTNGKERVVVVRDRIAKKYADRLDVSFGLAQYLGFAQDGLATLKVTILRIGHQ